MSRWSLSAATRARWWRSVASACECDNRRAAAVTCSTGDYDQQQRQADQSLDVREAPVAAPRSRHAGLHSRFNHLASRAARLPS